MWGPRAARRREVARHREQHLELVDRALPLAREQEDAGEKTRPARLCCRAAGDANGVPVSLAVQVDHPE